QSAWSGAPYVKEAIGAEDEIALVTDLGLVPLSEVSAEDSGAKKDKRTEIDAVVSEIERVQDELNIEALNSPWLPPLPNRINLPKGEDERANHFKIGLVAEPERQR